MGRLTTAEAARADRQRAEIHARRPERIADLMQSIARVVETGGYPQGDRTCPETQA